MLTTEHLVWKLGVSVTGQNYIQKILTQWNAPVVCGVAMPFFTMCPIFLGLLHSLFDFLSTKNCAFETDPSAKPLVKISFIYMRMKSRFLIIGFTISLALKQRLERLLLWRITMLPVLVVNQHHSLKKGSFLPRTNLKNFCKV